MHHFLPSSRTNGPGERAVVWVQGCSLGCPGCFNPQTHPRAAGDLIAVDGLFAHIVRLAGQIEGITISGGEPLQQRAGVEALVARVKLELGLSVVLFSGFSWGEIQPMPAINGLLQHVDILLAGRYDHSQRVAAGLLGSGNKTVHFLSGRYSLADLQAVPEAEVLLSADGEIVFSGINPLVWVQGRGE